MLSSILSEAFTWTAVGVYFALLVGVGGSLMSTTPPEFVFAKWCFVLASALMIIKSCVWLASIDLSATTRIALGFLLVGGTGVMGLEAWRWVDKRQTQAAAARELPPPPSQPVAQSQAPTVAVNSPVTGSIITQGQTGGENIVNNYGPGERALSETQLAAVDKLAAGFPSDVPLVIETVANDAEAGDYAHHFHEIFAAHRKTGNLVRGLSYATVPRGFFIAVHAEPGHDSASADVDKAVAAALELCNGFRQASIDVSCVAVPFVPAGSIKIQIGVLPKNKGPGPDAKS